ncbi:MAG: hypothetical protein JOZ70_01870 [Pseudolabrys sp.]|nr:hypothetical protein [Pseudolabrys sp.]MBV9953973.1 hypothetical protein [Pseudolabrys sp.]
MKRSRLVLAAALASGVSMIALQVQAADDPTMKTNPGFKASGQINPGETPQVPSGAPPGQNAQSGSGTEVQQKASPTDKTVATGEAIPSNEQARRALLTVEFKDPAIGQVPMIATPKTGGEGNAANNSGPGSGDPTTQSQGHAAIGGPLSPGAGKGDGGTTGASGQTDQERAAAQITQLSQGTSPGKPIGSQQSTVPAKYSERNATLDRVPVMAVPFKLSDEDRAKIFKAVMDDKTAATPGADNLKPASQLSTEQALDHMQALPQGVAGIKQISNLKFLKTNDKVLLVEPSTRIVVEEIEGSQKS